MNPSKINKSSTLDSKEGYITGSPLPDQIILSGSYIDPNNSYAEDLKLTLKTADTNQTIVLDVNASGYNFKIFLGDFTGDGLDNILISGGSGNFEEKDSTSIHLIYQYKDGQLIEVFNSDTFHKTSPCSIKYLDHYKVEISCQLSNEKNTVDIQNNPKIFLDVIYDQNGKTKTTDQPKILAIGALYPLQSENRCTYDLIIQQKVIGIKNSQILGLLESRISLQNCTPHILARSFHLFEGPSSFLHKRDSLENNMIPISLDSFGGKDGVLSVDLDNDKNDEIIKAYLLNGIPHLSVSKYIQGKLRVISTFKGKGYALSDLMIKPIRSKQYPSILVGWREDVESSKLDILEFRHNKLIRAVTNNLPHYGILKVEDMDQDGICEVALWLHDMGPTYRIHIYKIAGNILQPTNRCNKSYFPKVINYYENLLNKTHDCTSILYHLAVSYYKIADYQKALEIISDISKRKTPYPSLQKLYKLKSQILYKKQHR